MNGVTRRVLDPAGLGPACDALHEQHGRMQMAYALERDDGGLEVRYLAAPGSGQAFELWCCRPADGRLPTLTDRAPLLGWYEREMQDLFGLEFGGHPEPHRLVLHEGADPSVPPLRRAAPPGEALPFVRAPWTEPDIDGEDVQRLPFGPVRADVAESAQFVFYYLGEGILHYYPRLFFKHRGLEKRFEGTRPELGVVLAERVSGVGSLGHALAYCQAVEDACGCRVPEYAQWARTLLQELERIYNHLHYFAILADATTLKVGNAQGRLLEEDAKKINARVTGSRFLRNMLIPGGLRRALSGLDGLEDALDPLRRAVERYLAKLNATPSYRDRLIGTGVLTRRTAFDQGATGPVERASGLDRDLRRDHPYAAYESLPPEVTLAETGDADARAAIRRRELLASFTFVSRLLRAVPGGSLRAECRPEAGSGGLGWTEGPRGALYYAVHIGPDGQLGRVKIKSPSFSNWRVFPFTVHGTDMMDYAINEASFGLTIAGCDR